MVFQQTYLKQKNVFPLYNLHKDIYLFCKGVGTESKKKKGLIKLNDLLMTLNENNVQVQKNVNKLS